MATEAATAERGRRGRATIAAEFEQLAWLIFAGAALAAAVLIIAIGHGITFSGDELTWFLSSPDLDLHGALMPHAGHLLLTTRLVYKAIFELNGADYLPFRVLTAGSVVLTAGLFFAYAKRRVGAAVALAPTVILLVFGSDLTHMLLGNGFTVLGAVACGLGALLALDRGDRGGDLIAALLLCLGVVTYTVALAFVAGVAVLVLLRDDRWRRLWIVALPVALYGAWWLWARGEPSSSEEQLALSQLLTFPAWSFQSLDNVLGALTGLDYDFGGAPADAGPTLAVLALFALGYRLSRGSLPPMIWGAVAIVATLWLMEALASNPLRTPESSRYLFPGAIAVLVLAASAAAGLRWSRAALIGLAVVTVVGVATNLDLLRVGSKSLRSGAVQTRSELTGIEYADGSAPPDYVPAAPGGGATPTTLAFTEFAVGGGEPTRAYLAAVDRYGTPGYSSAEVAELDEAARAGVDSSLIAALGVGLAPTDRGSAGRSCEELDQGAPVDLAPGDAAVLEARAGATPVQLSRLASAGVEIGKLTRSHPALLRTPPDDAPGSWRLTASEAPIRVCTSP